MWNKKDGAPGVSVVFVRVGRICIETSLPAKRRKSGGGGFLARESMLGFVNQDNENNESRKKVVQKLAFWENEYPDPVEK